ncbi:MAG: DUF368 domain-containing protein [Gallicola sp.]|uniref:DUF368 domain-containing protein n=1 Tax=Gallicola sp. Sow4_E12 TaxID=3438785 RepID=UPI00179158D2|nr:DUF368 domain-containing protein [Gallicola sp.]
MKNINLKNKSTMDWLFRVIKGVFIGIGAILPGLSGGVLAVIFGIYDRMIEFMAKPTKKFLENVLYFVPVGIGVGLGILLFSFAVSAAFSSYETLFVCLFLGFVVGTFPSLYKQAGAEGREKKDLIITAVTAAVLFLIMNILQKGSLIQIDQPGMIAWAVAGFLVGLGFLIPGLSTSNFLMYFGMYSKMTDGISSFDFFVIIPITIGLFVCVLLFSKLIHSLLDHHYAKMFHFILGTVIGSSVAILTTVIFPSYGGEGLSKMGLSLGAALVGSILLFVIGVITSYAFSKVEERYSTN